MKKNNNYKNCMAHLFDHRCAMRISSNKQLDKNIAYPTNAPLLFYFVNAIIKMQLQEAEILLE